VCAPNRVALERAPQASRRMQPADAGEALRRFCPSRAWGHGGCFLESGVTPPRETELRRDGIELLARLDEPVRAVAGRRGSPGGSPAPGRLVRGGRNHPAKMGQRRVGHARTWWLRRTRPSNRDRPLALAGRKPGRRPPSSHWSLWRKPRNPSTPRGVLPGSTKTVATLCPVGRRLRNSLDAGHELELLDVLSQGG